MGLAYQPFLTPLGGSPSPLGGGPFGGCRGCAKPLGGCLCVCCTLPWAGCYPGVDVKTFVYSETTTAGLSIAAPLNKYADFQPFTLNGVDVTQALLHSNFFNSARINADGTCIWQSPVLACGVVVVLFSGAVFTNATFGTALLGYRMFLAAISADAALGPNLNITFAQMNPPCTPPTDGSTGAPYGGAYLICGQADNEYVTCEAFNPTRPNGSTAALPQDTGNSGFWGGLLSGGPCLPLGDNDDWASIWVTPAA